MQLHEAGDVAAAAEALLGNLLEEAGRVHAVDERHVGREVFHLVGLQVADEVPLDALATLFPVEQRGQRVLREPGNLLLKLLHVTFAEDALAGSVSLLERFDGMEFGNSTEAHSAGEGLCDVFDLFFNHALRMKSFVV